MESQSQNPQSSSEPSNQAKSSPASESAGNASQTGGKSPRAGQGAPETDNNGQERVSSLDDISTREPLSRTLGDIEQLGTINSQTGAAGKAHAALSSHGTPVQPRQSTSQSTSGGSGQGTSSGDQGGTPQWQTDLQTSLQKGWTAVAARVKAASPTQLALGAAAVGAAVWLGTRKRTPKQPKGSRQQSAADRWLDYPAGTDGSRSDGHYGQYNRASGQSGGQYSGQQAGGQYGSRYNDQSQQGQSAASPTAGSQSQTTNGPASGVYGQASETWQRPTDERWDD